MKVGKGLEVENLAKENYKIRPSLPGIWQRLTETSPLHGSRFWAIKHENLSLVVRLGPGKADLCCLERGHEAEEQRGRNQGPQIGRQMEKAVVGDNFPFLKRI